MSSDVVSLTVCDFDAGGLARSLITASTVVPRDQDVELVLSGADAIRVGREIEDLLRLRDGQDDAVEALQRALDSVWTLNASASRALRRAGLMLFIGSAGASWGVVSWVMG